MLFVSRFIGMDFFGVVDTETGIEQVLSLIELYKLCYEKGQHVVGVSHKERGHTINKIFPYQPEQTLTQMQIKAKMLLGVEVKVYKSLITSVRILPERMQKPVTLRLSCFGSACSDRILVGNDFVDNHKLTLILDDKIQFEPLTFFIGKSLGKPHSGFDRYGVVLDFSEVHKDAAVWGAYRTIYKDMSFDVSTISNSVRDIEERSNTMLKMLPEYDGFTWSALA